MRDPMQMQRPIVVVDDDESVRTAVARLFRSSQLRVEVFDSAEAFVSSGLIDSAGCLVVDVHMPGMNGFELQALCTRTRPGLPVIVMSAFDEDNPASRAAKASAQAFFHKPFSAVDLLME